MGRLHTLGFLLLIVAGAATAQVPLPSLHSVVTPEGLTIWEIEHPATIGETPFVFVVLLRSGIRDEHAASRGFTEDLRWSLMSPAALSGDRAIAGARVQSTSRTGSDHVAFRFSGSEADWLTVIQHAASLLVLTEERSLVPTEDLPPVSEQAGAPPWISRLQGIPPVEGTDLPSDAERRRHYEHLFHPERLIFAWSGRATSDRVTLAIRSAFHGLPRRAPEPTHAPHRLTEDARAEIPSESSALAYQVPCTRPEQYLSLLLMEQALKQAVAESAVVRSFSRDPATVWRGLNAFGTPFLAAIVPTVETTRSDSVQEALAACFASLRDLTPEALEDLRRNFVQSMVPRDAAGVELLAVEGLRLSRADDGRAIDVLQGLKQLRYADFRDTVQSSLAAGRALGLPAPSDDHRALYLVVYGISLALLIFLLLDAWLGMRLFRNLRASLQRPKPAKEVVLVQNRRSQTEQLVREIQSWYREQDRLRERPDHRD